jgi:hypothetical protein
MGKIQVQCMVLVMVRAKYCRILGEREKEREREARLTISIVVLVVALTAVDHTTGFRQTGRNDIKKHLSKGALAVKHAQRTYVSYSS